MASAQQLASLTSQCNEIVRYVSNGSLNPDKVSRALQDIIESKKNVHVWSTPAWNPPEWWRTPEEQLKTARDLFGDIFLPPPPAEFVPQTDSEVLLLHVPETFDALWRMVVPPSGYVKTRSDAIAPAMHNMRIVHEQRAITQPLWVGFDPENARGRSPDDMWVRTELNLAASEVLSALIQFPDWPLYWSEGASRPIMAGYQIEYEGHWRRCPVVALLHTSRQLRVDAAFYNFNPQYGASPSIRKLPPNEPRH